MPEFRDQSEQAATHTPRVRPEQEAGRDGDQGLEIASTLGNANVQQVLQNPGVQRSGATAGQQLDESVARAIEERRGRGQPLDDGVREQMESSLGHDLSDVRVHTDSNAHELNEAVRARAFTTGDDVFFTQGTYDPGSSSGQELLAHELTHVVQQRTGASGLDAGEVSDPADPAEQHAEAMGRTVASQTSGPAPAAGDGSSSAGVAREAMPDEEDQELQMAREPGVARAEVPEEEDELQMAREPGVSRAAPEEELEEETA